MVLAITNSSVAKVMSLSPVTFGGKPVAKKGCLTGSKVKVEKKRWQMRPNICHHINGNKINSGGKTIAIA